ncbi:DUF1996 domain-containing protein [Aspergillus puulaauensis]|uniref:DUF1996 domain-containing protein n=1 Tax=Aspergillus puulaauensis TaxID=1220207 RepID=A0A7R7XED2_9EURO|nr:uncharacterized protein APUU_20308S [Aspergillus puulaauensis]BCS19876.1 hypothetical protein APUU_20308S [Aspergillus puulaauensis]
MQALSLLLATGLAHAYTVTNVDFLMFKNIDPIVFPGQYVSHMHSFFGSDAVNVNTSDSEELRQGVPTLYLVDNTKNETHQPLVPMRFSAYYEDLDSAEIPFPENYQIMAGNASATTQEHVNSDNGISWFCEGDSDEEKDDAAFPTKTCSTHLQMLLVFPNCANPETFKSAYSKNPDWYEGYGENYCPHGMYRIPQLRFSIRYDLRTLLPDGWEGQPPLELACGPSYCSHGDFINGWLPEAAEYMLKDTSQRDFFQIEGPLGSGDQGTACTETPQDCDPDHGTSDYLESLKMMSNSTIQTRATDAKTAAGRATPRRRHSLHHHRF